MNRTLAQAIAVTLVFFVSFTTAPLLSAQAAQPAANQPAPEAQQPAAEQPSQTQEPSQAPTATQPSHQPPVELPENPGRSTSQAPNTNATPQQSPAKTEPDGTAVAPPIQTSGGAASKPAGVAIAPPKQRRVRSLLIKLGAIAGVGVAVGTVAALSAASPSRVPNSTTPSNPGH